MGNQPADVVLSILRFVSKCRLCELEHLAGLPRERDAASDKRVTKRDRNARARFLSSVIIDVQLNFRLSPQQLLSDENSSEAKADDMN